MRFCHPEERPMAENVYKVLELIGTSTESWGRAAMAAVERAAETLRDLRVAEVVEQDLQITADGKVEGRLCSRHGAAARWVFARVGPPKVDDALRWAQRCTPSSGMIRPTSRQGRPVSVRRRTPSPSAA